MKYFAYTIIGVVALSIIAGFFIIGSPAQERLRRADEQRVWHLQTIQSEIINYWINKAHLPEKLADLEDSISGFVVPSDPVTGTSYEYTVRGPEMFSLCATFDLPNAETNWQHQAGYSCFDRTIDVDLYRPKKVAL